MSETKIQWTDVTWNPVRGCSIVSPGCHNCYAMRTARRFDKPGGTYEGLTKPGPHGPQWSGKLKMVEDKLDEPLHWRDPKMVFVNSMSDLFHEDVPDAFIDRVFETMAATPRHTYQVLTKRSDRLSEYFKRPLPWAISRNFPLPNVWLGVSVEDQRRADERIQHLIATPAAMRFLSCEPLLGPLNLVRWLTPFHGVGARHDGIGWVIIGGESGPGARYCEADWIESIIDQCKAAGVPVFVKQLGSNASHEWHRCENCGKVESADGFDVLGADGDNLFCTDCHTEGLHQHDLRDRKGGDPSEWPEDFRVREWPAVRDCLRGETDMTLNEYQRDTAKTAIYPHEHAIDYCILGLCSEAGELAGKRKKQIRDGDITDDELAAELGDVLWYVARLAAELDCTLESIAISNLCKLADRQRRGVIGGSGDER